MRALQLIWVTTKISLQNQMAYRVDWFARVLQTAVGIATTLGAFYVVFSHTTSLAGWTFAQAIALLGVFYIVQGLVGMLLSPNMAQIMTDVREGTLDFVLVKPVNSQFYTGVRKIEALRIVDVLLGFVVAAYASHKIASNLSAAQALLFLAILGCGMIILYSVWLVLVTLTFWFTRVFNIEQIVFQALEAGRYPIDVYPGWIRFALSYIIPVGFIITVPSRSLLGELQPTGIFTAMALALATFLAASVFWRTGLRHYSGASA